NIREIIYRTCKCRRHTNWTARTTSKEAYIHSSHRVSERTSNVILQAVDGPRLSPSASGPLNTHPEPPRAGRYRDTTSCQRPLITRRTPNDVCNKRSSSRCKLKA